MSRTVSATPADWRIRVEWQSIRRVGGQWRVFRQTKTDEMSTDGCNSTPTGRERAAVVSPQDQQSHQEPIAAIEEYHPALRRGFGPFNGPARPLKLIDCLIINRFVRLVEWLGGELMSKMVYLVVETGEPMEMNIIAGAG